MARQNQYRKTVNERLKQDKELMLKTLREMPIIAVCCEKTNIGRTTFYNWRKDKEFRRLSDEAMKSGDDFLNDMAKSQLVSLMRDQNWPTIKYYLDHRHPEYMPKETMTTRNESLTKEEEAVVRQALKLVVRPKNI
jgi:hypothetical protein